MKFNRLAFPPNMLRPIALSPFGLCQEFFHKKLNIMKLRSMLLAWRPFSQLSQFITFFPFYILQERCRPTTATFLYFCEALKNSVKHPENAEINHYPHISLLVLHHIGVRIPAGTFIAVDLQSQGLKLFALQWIALTESIYIQQRESRYP